MGGGYFAQENVIPDSGNVGIGTLTPTTKLDVHGRVKIDSSLFVNDSITIMGNSKMGGELRVEENECFLPVKSALDITDGTSNYYYNVRGNGLLWDRPYNPITNPTPSEPYGYPTIIYGTSSYGITPFDAIYCAEENGPHGAKEEPALLDLTSFILSEIHYDTIYLQHRNLGWQYQNNTKSYACDIIAEEVVKMGENVTFKAQPLPFTIFPNTHTNIKAGNAIELQPGTSIFAGATAHFYIETPDEYDCLGKNARSITELDEQESSSKLRETEEGNAESIRELKNIQIYPNPNDGHFTIETQEKCAVHIMNLMGVNVYNQELVEGKNEMHLDLIPGVYIVKISTRENQESLKILIQ